VPLCTCVIYINIINSGHLKLWKRAGNPEVWEIKFKNAWVTVSIVKDRRDEWECVVSVGYGWPCWMLPYSEREKHLKCSIVPGGFHCHPKVWDTCVLNVVVQQRFSVLFFTKWLDYTLITNLMDWLLFIHKLLFSSTCFEHQVLIFRRT